MWKVILALTQIDVRHSAAQTGVSPEYNLLAFSVHRSLCEGASGHTEPIYFKLGDGEKVSNPFIIDSHIKKTYHIFCQGRRDTIIALPTEKLSGLIDIW